MTDDKPFDMTRATYWLDAMRVEQSYAPLERFDVISCDLVTDMAAEIERLQMAMKDLAMLLPLERWQCIHPDTRAVIFDTQDADRG